jgi:DNA polymerase-3 subunit alpha
MLEARDAGGGFRSVYDFCERVSLKQLNKKTLETLVRSGAFDTFGVPRQRLVAALDGAIEAARSTQRDKEVGQESLFGGTAAAVSVKPREHYDEKIPEWPERERLKYEKEAIGFYVTGHPLARYESDLARVAGGSIARLEQAPSNATVSLGVTVGAVRERPLKDGSGRMAFVVLEDRSGTTEVRVGPREFAEYESLLKGDEPLLVRGTIWHDRSNETPQVRFRVQEIRSLADVRASGARRVELELSETQIEVGRLVQLRDTLRAFPGRIPVGVKLTIPETAEVEMRLPSDVTIEPSEALVDRVEAIFGRGVVRFA